MSATEFEPSRHQGTMVPIQFLRRGEKGTISDLWGDAEDIRRLAELGLQAGTPVEIVKGGSPCIARIGDRDLCLRSGESIHVLVRLSGAA